MFTLHNGDCLEIMPTLPAGSVDAIITDLPYGTTAGAWDVVIPFAPMWEQVKRILKPSGAFITTASQPFTSILIVSNLEWFKYEIIWDKQSTADFLLAKYQPMKYHENVCIFGNGRITYNPQMWQGNKNHRRSGNTNHFSEHIGQSFKALPDNLNGKKYPRSILEILKHTSRESLHQSQKPVALYEYLINTYTNFGETVLDFCMGSGTTIEAAIKTGRKSIGIERDPKYFAVAERRISQAAQQPALFHATQQSVQRTGGESGSQSSLFTDESYSSKVTAKSTRR